jgi:hypothetical protein
MNQEPEQEQEQMVFLLFAVTALTIPRMQAKAKAIKEKKRYQAK